MKTAIIGGGPAGLYFAILQKKLRPESDITVYERNRADETFGFGVVFSDATLDNFEKYDLPSYQRIVREFAYWDDIAIHFRGTEHRIEVFGTGGGARVAQTLGSRFGYDVPVLGEVPLDPSLLEGGDTGKPIVESDPTAPAARALVTIADRLSARGRGLAGMQLGLSPTAKG